MNFGDRKTQMSSEAVPADQDLTHQARHQRLGDDSPGRRRASAFTSTTSPGCDELAGQPRPPRRRPATA